MTDILNMGSPFACVCIAAVVLVYLIKKVNG